MEGPSRTTGRKSSWSRWSGWIALLWAACFLYLGMSASPPRLPVSGFERLDLVGHAGAAGLLAVLVGEWLLVGRGMTGERGLGWAFGAAAGLGMVIEVMQTTSTVRSFEALDLVADLVGAGAGVLLYAYAADRVPRRALTPMVLGAGLVAVVAAGVSMLVA